MTTFIDFRYSRALAAALFTGQEKEETEILFPPDCDTCFALAIRDLTEPRTLAHLVGPAGTAATLTSDGGALLLSDAAGNCLVRTTPSARDALVGLRVGPSVCGLRVHDVRSHADVSLFGAGNGAAMLTAASSSRVAPLSKPAPLRLNCGDGVRVMGRGSGRAARWGELFYHRHTPSGLCIELTMDWHHLRAGIPLFATMTAEEIIFSGAHRLRFRSYAYEASDAEMTDFVQLFSCDDSPDVAVHLTPALYDLHRRQLPNLGFGVTESDWVHPQVVERCNHMDRLAVPSAFVRNTLVRAGVTRPIDVISHGVETGYFRPVAQKQPLPGGRGFNFLAIGTHVERKNFKHLVRAFLEEFREREDVALFLLLRPEYHTTQNNVALEFTEWERTWARNSAPIYLWTGYLTQAHLRDFYANANAYVMPSNEGFGLTLLEAMSSGTPVIGLRHGGVLDFLNSRNGILIPPGRRFDAQDIDTLPYVGDSFHEPDLPSLRSAMRRLFEDRSLGSALAVQARADAEKLDWRSVTDKFVRCIEQTHAEFHARPALAVRAQALNGSSTRRALTFVLCIVDDEDARVALDHLNELGGGGVGVLCLFTRYARMRDIMRARRYGFPYYRWDGTMDNCKTIARGLVGSGWIVVLHPDERVEGKAEALIDFVAAQQPDVTQVSVSVSGDIRQPRAFDIRPHSGPPVSVEYSGITIRRLSP